MAFPPPSPQVDDRHYLRTDQESDADSSTQKPAQAFLDRTDAPNVLWPLPDNLESILHNMKQWDRHAVLAVKIDSSAIQAVPEALRANLEALLAEMAEHYNGIWFPWQNLGYGVVIPGVDASTAFTLADEIRANLAKRRVETVSIGLTEYPHYGFDHSDSLLNAAKALDHSGFFGPNTSVTFDTVSLNISGDRFYQANDIDNAMEEYRRALEMDATNINARNSLGVCLAEKGDLNAARIEFERVCRAIPHDALALFNLGLIHLNRDDTDQAKVYFEEAYKADQNTFDIPYQLGKLFLKQGRHAQALGYLKAANTLRDDYAPLFSLMGQCLTDLGHTNQAITVYKKAIKLNPNDADALSDLGMLYAKKGENLDICATFCRQSVLIDPHNGRFRFRLACLLHEQGRLDQALEEYEQSTDLGYAADDQISELRRQLTNQQDDGMRCA